MTQKQIIRVWPLKLKVLRKGYWLTEIWGHSFTKDSVWYSLKKQKQPFYSKTYKQARN